MITPGNTSQEQGLALDSAGPLMDEVSLHSYVSGATQRLAEYRESRRNFLESACTQLASLRDNARSLGFAAMDSEIGGWIERAVREIDTLGATAPALETTPLLEIATAPEVIPAPSLLEPELPDVEAGIVVEIDHGAIPAGSEPVADVPRAPLPPQPEPTSAVPYRHLEPRWNTRSLDDILAALEDLRTDASELQCSGDAGLLRLKILGCRERRAYRELEIQVADKQPAYAVFGILLEAAHQYYPAVRIVPLDTSLTPSDPMAWEIAAEAYEFLAGGYAAMEWLFDHESDIRTSEREALLNGAAASQQFARRTLEEMVRSSDPQQEHLFRRLRDYAAEAQIFIKNLSNSNLTDEKLKVAAVGLGAVFASIREGIEKKQRQRESLSDLLALLRQSDFGISKTDEERLTQTVVTCLNAGIPPSNKEMRDALLPWHALLGNPQVKRVVAEVQKEVDRREKTGMSALDDDGETALTPEIQTKLSELLPYTQGKVMLFMGGKPLQEKRAEITQVLKLSDLEWTNTNGAPGAGQFEAAITRCDIAALLIRFMRHGYGEVDQYCDLHGKRLIRIPSGLGINRIIHDLHAQLVPRS